MDLSGAVMLGGPTGGLNAHPDVEREQMETMELPDNNPIVRELKAMDPYLSIVCISERAEAPGLRPGLWHVKRSNPGEINTYMPIITPEGGYRVPDSAVINQLRERDTWRDDVRIAIRKHRDQKVADEKADDLARRLGLKDEFLGRVKALRDPGIRYGGSWRARLGDAKRAQ